MVPFSRPISPVEQQKDLGNHFLGVLIYDCYIKYKLGVCYTCRGSFVFENAT